jgi:hypothetical protein
MSRDGHDGRPVGPGRGIHPETVKSSLTCLSLGCIRDSLLADLAGTLNPRAGPCRHSRPSCRLERARSRYLGFVCVQVRVGELAHLHAQRPPARPRGHYAGAVTSNSHKARPSRRHPRKVPLNKRMCDARDTGGPWDKRESPGYRRTPLPVPCAPAEIANAVGAPG